MDRSRDTLNMVNISGQTAHIVCRLSVHLFLSILRRQLQRNQLFLQSTAVGEIHSISLVWLL